MVASDPLCALLGIAQATKVDVEKETSSPLQPPAAQSLCDDSDDEVPQACAFSFGNLSCIMMHLPGGQHACPRCGKMVHNLCHQQAKDQENFEFGVTFCGGNMCDGERKEHMAIEEERVVVATRPVLAVDMASGKIDRTGIIHLEDIDMEQRTVIRDFLAQAAFAYKSPCHPTVIRDTMRKFGMSKLLVKQAIKELLSVPAGLTPTPTPTKTATMTAPSRSVTYKDWMDDPVERGRRVWLWWRRLLHGKIGTADFPAFAHALRLVATVRPSSAAVGRVFSHLKRIVDVCGRRCLAENVEARMFAKFNAKYRTT